MANIVDRITGYVSHAHGILLSESSNQAPSRIDELSRLCEVSGASLHIVSSRSHWTRTGIRHVGSIEALRILQPKVNITEPCSLGYNSQDLPLTNHSHLPLLILRVPLTCHLLFRQCTFLPPCHMLGRSKTPRHNCHHDRSGPLICEQ